MSQKSAKSAAELESMIMAELREHPERESAGVAVKPTGVAVLIRAVPQANDDCEARLGEIVGRLRQEFDLSE
jgi:hypothetical protein